MMSTVLSRRAFFELGGRGLARAALGIAGMGTAASALGFFATACGDGSRGAGADAMGALGPPDANGLRLPAGFSSRIVARSGELVASSAYRWHANPDGGAVFATNDGGWVYVSNAETNDEEGGVGVLRFDAGANVVDAYSILAGTSRNCAGGRTPWQTWLSCEEIPSGRVFECDPFSPGSQGVVRPALGTFCHEAVAVDPVGQRLYLTEDEPDGRLYRFTPTAFPSLSNGLLEVAEIADPLAEGAIAPGQVRPLLWHPVNDPLALVQATRNQVPQSTPFDGGEGVDYHDGRLFFSTKGDDRLWRIDLASDRIEIVYDRATSTSPILTGVDNVFAAPNGDLYVAEDPGDLQIVALSPSGLLVPLVQATGQSGSELTGPALSPDGRRFYFSSQRGPGTTYEIEGPFV